MNEMLIETRQEIDNYLLSLIPAVEDPENMLFDAARYAISGGGKRIRPILTLLVAELFGKSPEVALPAAASVELIHTYSMIHDDLPCMDDDDYRRGRPTLHRAYPEAIALLAGDYLLTYAFELLADAPNSAKLVSVLAKAAGGSGMVGGQVLDILSVGQEIDATTLKRIHIGKTARLIQAAIVMGALVSEASEQEVTTLEKFGEAIGLAFQITDDIIDVTESEAKHGHATSSDEQKNKPTYVSLFGIEAAREQAKELFETSCALLETLDVDTQKLVDISKQVAMRG